MIPKLTLDEAAFDALWKDEENYREGIKQMYLGICIDNDSIPIHYCDDNAVKMGMFKEFKDTVSINRFFRYGYCDTEESLIKYLQTYKNDPENSYFIQIGFMSTDYEKYYKNGTYVNKDGVNTHMDYWDYIHDHPEMKVEQECKGKWICFSIYKLK